MGYRVLLCLLFLLAGCAKESEGPIVFLPRVVGPNGVDLDALRTTYCQGIKVSLDENFLTNENFRSIFNCANYDSTLEPMRALFTSREFPAFLKNMNTILSSGKTSELKETLRNWLEEGSQGGSRLDRLLPILAKIIKNPSFQDGLPLVSDLLQAGKPVWRELLPGLADLVYQDRFPHNFDDLSELFSQLSSENSGTNSRSDYATNLKKWAAFLKSEQDGKTISLRVLELAHRLESLEIPNTSIREYLDQLNEKGVFVSLYLDSGAVRGETQNPKLNADPDEEEIRDGLNFTPEERKQRAYRKLFAAGPEKQKAPIVQLADLVEEFHQPHPDFLVSLSRWFAANGPRVSNELTEYVYRAQVLSGLTRLSAEVFLTKYFQEQGKNPRDQVNAEQFRDFLKEAFASKSFSVWINEESDALNREQFGIKNAQILRTSGLFSTIFELYNREEISQFGFSLLARPATLASAIKRFSNLHRGEKLEFDFSGKVQGVEAHLLDVWWKAGKENLGESVVVEFAIKLTQTLVSEFASDFSQKHNSLSEWYFSSPYGNPGTTEALAGYAFKELDFLAKYKKHKEYFKTTFANEVFANEEDKRAFRLLVDQIPNIWLYLRSGMSRSGNDLTRALASKDRGYLIKGYVDLIVEANRKGLILDGVKIIESYHESFPASAESPPVQDSLAERRRISKGVDALKRVMRSLFEPEIFGAYETSTLGRFLVPVSSLVSDGRRLDTERFFLTSADEILASDNQKLNNFLNDFFAEKNDSQSPSQRRETLKSISDFLRDPIFPDVIQQLNGFFQEDAVKPALDFLAKKIDDGSLNNVLIFVRRILGFRG